MHCSLINDLKHEEKKNIEEEKVLTINMPLPLSVNIE
jgi:hypothetical protein